MDKIDIYFCPDCHGLFEFARGTAYQFRNEYGIFIKAWEKPKKPGQPFTLKLHNMYLIGEL